MSLKRSFTVSQQDAPAPVKRGRYMRPRRKNSTNLRSAIRKEILKQAETKFTVANGEEISLPVSTAYTMVDFPVSISQGTSASQRIGNKIVLTGLDCNEMLWNPSSDVAEAVSIRRLILKVDGGVYQTNTEVANDLFEGTSVDSGANTTTLDLVRKVNRQSMTVMKDDVITLNAAASGHSQAHLKNYFKMNTVLEFQESTTAAPVNWRYVVVYLARQTANDGAIFNCELTYQLGVYFKDL